MHYVPARLSKTYFVRILCFYTLSIRRNFADQRNSQKVLRWSIVSALGIGIAASQNTVINAGTWDFYLGIGKSDLGSPAFWHKNR